MSKAQQQLLFVLRLALGWLFLYAGITKVMNPQWTAAGFLKGAKLMPGFFNWLAGPSMIAFTNFVNEWGLTLLGVSLILGIGMRYSTVLGSILMLLYYIPRGFPKPDPNSYIVDSHIVYALALLLLGALEAGKYYGLDAWAKRTLGRYPILGTIVK